MTVDAPAAVLCALALLRSPRDARPASGDRLPTGIAQLLRIAGGDAQALAAARNASGADDQEMRDAAVFYVQQVLFAPGADSYRVLGVDSDADDDRIKEHYRWLVRWLHPDRNPDAWEAIYADRVNRAWQDLRTRDRRQRFDDSRANAPALTAATARAATVPVAAIDAAGVSWRWLRWLPHLVFAGLGACAVLAVGTFYLLRWNDSKAVPSAAMASLEPGDSVGAAKVEDQLPAPGPATTTPTAPVAAASRIDPPATAAPMPALPASETGVANRPVATSLVTARRDEVAPGKALNAVVPAPPAQLPAQAQQPTSALSPPALDTAPRQADAGPLPTVLPAATQPVAVAAEAALAEGVLSQFQQAYAAGDMGRLERLFVASSESGRTSPVTALQQYQRLFKQSVSRRLWVEDVSWIGSGDRATIIASYQSEVWFAGDRAPKHRTGDMRLDLRRLQGDWRIETVRHD
jgi:hypothetical protein